MRTPSIGLALSAESKMVRSRVLPGDRYSLSGSGVYGEIMLMDGRSPAALQ